MLKRERPELVAARAEPVQPIEDGNTLSLELGICSPQQLCLFAIPIAAHMHANNISFIIL